MLMRLCQLKSLILVFLLCSCSWNKREVHPADEVMNTFPTEWFSVNRNHSLQDSTGSPISHLFFDTVPEFLSKEKTVNVIIVTPENSPYAYRLDLATGQRYFDHAYCKQEDVWGSYSGSIERPQFSIAYMPRVLDQSGEAQKVLVWSKRKGFTDIINTNYHKVRLVGAYSEQLCPEGNCIGKNNWISRLVFLAVDAEDQSLSSIKNIQDFTGAYDWTEIKATLENIEGRNFIGNSTYPMIKVNPPIDIEPALESFKMGSIFFTQDELKKIQKGCHLLYNRLWEKVGKVLPEDRPITTVEELNKKIKEKESNKNAPPTGFASRFRRFTKKYFNEVSTCEKFVYHGNINGDREIFWFLGHMGLYYRLHREGYYFDCKNRTWRENTLNDKGLPIYDFQKELEQCKEKEIDQAMNSVPNFLSSLKGERDFYRFIDYDNHTFGTHKKLYSWVKTKSKRYSCSNDPNIEIKKGTRLFPEDVSWKTRVREDMPDAAKIIY